MKVSNIVQSVLLFVSLANATPVAQFPFNNQLPPVARYGEPYSYTFNPNTYSSSETIVYSAPDLPSWLKFDASSMTFSGTPPASDKSNGDVLFNFTLQAADADGTLSSICQLQLSAADAPQVQPQSELQSVLQAAGPISSNNSLVLSPGQDFTIQFPSDYFSSDGRSVIGHYAVTEDHAPLPIWLNFDGQQGKYWGTAPTVNSGIAPAESFEILYIVSTYQGFSSASSSFTLLLGAHAFSTNLTTDQVNITVGEFFDYEIPFNQITLNQQNITRANVSKVDVSLPDNASWLSYNDGNSSIYGTAPADAANSTFNAFVQVFDNYGDNVNFTVELDVVSKKNTTIFSSSAWRPINVTADQFFQYSIADYVLAKDANITVDTHGASWLNFNQGNYSIYGQAPSDFNGTTVDFKGSIPGVSQESLDSQSASLTLLGVSKKVVASTTSSSASASASRTASATKSSTATASATHTSAAVSSKKKNHTVAIACGVAIPLAALAVLAALLFFCCRRRRQQKEAAAAGGDEPKKTPIASSPGGVDTANVSDPIVPADGLLMAPVFKTNTVDDSDGTFVETPEMKTDDPAAWSTPHRVSAYNFMRMDDEDTDEEHDFGKDAPKAPPRALGHGIGSTPVDGVAAGAAAGAALATAEPRNVDPATIRQRTIRNATPLLVGGAAGATSKAAQQTEEYSNVPRESWRHTNITDRRWQDARISYHSQASISSEEPVTVQLASAEFEGAGQNSISPNVAAAAATRGMTRDESSGIVHYLTSDVSSPDLAYGDEATPRLNNKSQFTPIQEAESDGENSGHYTTASSGDEHEGRDTDEGSLTEDLNIRPYRNEQGELEWNETGEQTGTKAKLVSRQSVNRRPSQVGHQAAESQAGEFAFV